MDNPIDSIAALAQQYEDNLPPVHLWNPDLNGDLDMRIDREGRWFYQGDEIRREGLVKLFSSIIKQEDDDYFLVTPVEKWRITVEVAPFLIVSIRQESDQLIFRTNVGNEFALSSAEHPLHVLDGGDGSPQPIVKAQRQLDALLSRSVFYELVEMADIRSSESGDILVVKSGTDEFLLGDC